MTPPSATSTRPRFSCPVAALLDTLGKRWMLLILHHISHGIHHFNALKNVLGFISSRTLNERLKELEEEGFITRAVVESRPVRIEYRLTPRGKNVQAALHTLGEAVG